MFRVILFVLGTVVLVAITDWGLLRAAFVLFLVVVLVGASSGPRNRPVRTRSEPVLPGYGLKVQDRIRVAEQRRSADNRASQAAALARRGR